MEVSSTLICPQCNLQSVTEETCSHCGVPISAGAFRFKSDLQASSHSIESSSTLDDPAISETLQDSKETGTDDHKERPPSDSDSQPKVPSDAIIYHPIFWGRGRTLFGIFVVNTLYTLLTLGIYSFWGRVRIRKFLSSQTSLAKIRFSYHGTGKELINGWTKAMIVFGIPYAFLNFVPVIWEAIPIWIPNALATIMVLCFIPVAVVGSHRYRLSRTALGAIRFSFRGQVKAYMKIWFTGTFLTLLTAGVYYPFFENARRDFLVRHTYLGNRSFFYHGTGSELLGIYAKALGLAGIICLGLLASLANPEALLNGEPQEWRTVLLHSWFPVGLLMLLCPWFYLQACKQRYFWNHTAFGNAPFQFTASTWNVIELRLTNFLMLVLTFGLAWSWVQVRNLQFLYYYLGLQVPLNFHQIEQEALDASPTGEELAGYFDAGFDLG